MDDVGDDEGHDEDDHGAVKGCDRPAPPVVREPEAPDPPYVEHEGDDSYGKADIGADVGRGTEQWRQNWEDHVAEEATQRRDQDGGAEYPVRRGVVG